MNNIFEENSGNPFNDPEFKRNFLKDKGLLKEDKTEGYEVLPPEDPMGKESGSVINPVSFINSSSKIPASVKSIMHDVSGSRGSGAIDKVQKSADIKNALNKVFTDYNEAYGLELHVDLDSTANMLAELADPEKFRIFELYVNNAYSRLRSMVYLKMMQSIMLLVDDITNPKNLLGTELNLADKWNVLDRMLNLFNQMEMVKDSIKIEGAEEELTRMGEDLKSGNSERSDVRDTANVKEFMEAMLRKSTDK